MKRYDYNFQNQKERKQTDNQKFLSYSLDAPSKQLNFMPHTYPGLPSYYQVPIEDYLRSIKKLDETIEIQDLINQNSTKHEINKFQQNFPLKNQLYKVDQKQIGKNRQMLSGISLLQANNLSRMPQFQDPSLRSMLGMEEISSIAVDRGQNVTQMKVEQNLLNVFNMKEEVDKIYKKLIN